MTGSGGGWFDSLRKKATELGAEGADRFKKQIGKEVRELKKRGATIKSAMSDLHDVARGDRDMAEFVTTYRPKLQGWLRQDMGPRWYRLLYDDSAIVPALDMAYNRIPPPMPWFVRQQTFVDFCKKHRDTLLGERALRIDELRARIAELSEPEAERGALAERIAQARGEALDEAGVAGEVDFAVRYIASAPDIMASTAAASEGSGRYDILFPVLAELEFHFLDAEETAPTDLPALLETAYLALGLIQTLSDRSIERELPPLIDVDLRPANARIARALGGAAADVDARVAAIIEESDFMERAGKIVGKAVPVIAVAAMIASVTAAAAGGGGGGGGGDDGGVPTGGGGSRSVDQLHEHAVSGAYTGALFGGECVARF